MPKRSSHALPPGPRITSDGFFPYSTSRGRIANVKRLGRIANVKRLGFGGLTRLSVVASATSLGLIACSGGAVQAHANTTAEPRATGLDAPPAPTMAAGRSDARGASYHFCGWGQEDPAADLEALREGISWYYNWSSRPVDCEGGVAADLDTGDDATALEFVPMAWGLVDAGSACDDGGLCFRVDERMGGERCGAICDAVPEGELFGPGQACYDCYHEGISRDAFLADIPERSRYLLGYNEPNFKEQAALTPNEAAAGWRHVEWVADQRALTLVGPAVNFCDTTPGVHHPGACVEVDDGTPMLGFAWLERFYDACTAEGAAGYDCRIDHQALHLYTCSGVSWYLDMLRQKAGLIESEPHCYDGVQNEDEFAVDCGGNVCAACSEHAREVFGRPMWLTEFAPSANDCGFDDPDDLVARAAEYATSELAILEADPLVYRYAWFMPRVGPGNLGHGSLLAGPGELTPVGEAYLGAP